MYNTRMQNPDKFCKKGEIVMDIKTFAVFPDKRFKYGGFVYIGKAESVPRRRPEKCSIANSRYYGKGVLEN